MERKAEYYNEDNIKAFAKAVLEDDYLDYLIKIKEDIISRQVTYCMLTSKKFLDKLDGLIKERFDQLKRFYYVDSISIKIGDIL